METMQMIAAYYILAADFTWRRSTNLSELITHYQKKKCDYFIHQMVFKNCTTEEAENIMNCFCVTGMGDIMRCSGLDQQDIDMINKHFVGWISTLVETKKKKTKKQLV